MHFFKQLTQTHPKPTKLSINAQQQKIASFSQKISVVKKALGKRDINER